MLFISPPPPPVPFYSQFENISIPSWRGKSCGVTDLAMIIDYYTSEAVTADEVLSRALEADGYIEHVGWTYKSLITVAKQYGLDGSSYDWKLSTDADALNKFKAFLKDGPVIASVHYKFDPKNPIPHLVVVTGIVGNDLYYNDPAADGGGKTIPVDIFLKAWKKRLVVIRPPEIPHTLGVL